MKGASLRGACLLVALLAAGLQALAADSARAIPQALPAHPGNIFLAGENVVVPAPPGSGDAWRVVNYENKTIASGRLKNGRAEVGPLPVGWYKVVRGGRGYLTNRVFLGVLAPLRAPTPLTSPIGLDVAMAWFFPKEKMGQVANLCELAGISRVRDRLLWQAMEPERGRFAASNQYDDSARIQSQAGLQVLQVAHGSANWANPNTRRFPLDLRDIYNFYREMARRWRGQIVAFEPWNEADIKLFGGHTGNEMASLQKAAYLGLKAGNPDVIACQNVFAIRRGTTLHNFNDNEAGAYFDRFNLHNYEPLENYPALYADFRAVSAGKPMWVTETSIHVNWRGDEHLKELGNDDLQLQSERLTKTYALSLHEGAEAVFYFLLPHYTERQLQFGLLRPDLTPRPGYVALAAVGRLLADAKPLGRLPSSSPDLHGYLFDAKPDGQRSDVLVVWLDHGGSFELARPPQRCLDHLGRIRSVTNNVLTLGRAPVFAVLADNSRPELIPPPPPATLLPGHAGVVVLQSLPPEEEVVLNKSAYKIAPGQSKTVPLFAYNFGKTPVRGRLQESVPEQWTAQLSRQVEIPPNGRVELKLTITCPAAHAPTAGRVRVVGDFGEGGQPVLAMRFAPVTD